MKTDQQIYMPGDKPPLSRWIPLSFQHVFAMFGATVLVCDFQSLGIPN